MRHELVLLRIRDPNQTHQLPICFKIKQFINKGLSRRYKCSRYLNQTAFKALSRQVDVYEIC